MTLNPTLSYEKAAIADNQGFGVSRISPNAKG